jgi:hypothetical protein
MNFLCPHCSHNMTRIHECSYCCYCQDIRFDLTLKYLKPNKYDLINIGLETNGYRILTYFDNGLSFIVSCYNNYNNIDLDLEDYYLLTHTKNECKNLIRTLFLIKSYYTFRL